MITNDQAEQMDNMRERLERDAEKEEKLKEGLSESSLEQLQKYFFDTYDVMSDDSDKEDDRFDEWFQDTPYHELLEILNK